MVARNPFDPVFEELSETLPVFPLRGVLLLPGCRLPLNIFEPRYLAMTEAALGEGRLIGMAQPRDPDADLDSSSLYDTGCAGRIVSFSESDDGRYLITLKGVCRFQIAEELEVETPYRRVVPRWDPFREDLKGNRKAKIDRERFIRTVRSYLEALEIRANWKVIEEASDAKLVNSLAMACPFEAGEKQALLEAPTLEDRARTMLTLMEMASASVGEKASKPQ